MNYKLLLLTGIFILLVSPLINSEIYLWENQIKDSSNDLVRDHLYYQFKDTSLKGIGYSRDTPVYLTYVIEALPYNLTGYGGEVDWCNLTIKHLKNTYGTNFVFGEGFVVGELLNSTTEIQNIYFTTGGLNTSTIEINMRNDDTILADIDCHYTNSSTLYVENALIGRWTTYIPAFECAGCTQYSLEELSQQVENQQNITNNELEIYNKIQTAVNWNFQIWLILSWILKVVFVLVGVFLIFGAGYYFYKLLTNLGRGR